MESLNHVTYSCITLREEGEEGTGDSLSLAGESLSSLKPNLSKDEKRPPGLLPLLGCPEGATIHGQTDTMNPLPDCSWYALLH